MLFPKRKQESLLRQSLLNRFKRRVLQKDGAAKHKEKVRRSTLDLSELSERPRVWSLPSETELKNYLGPVDERLVENAETAQRNRRRRTDGTRYSIQLSSSDLRTLDGESRLRTMPLPRYFLTKQRRAPFDFEHKFCELMELPGAEEHKRSDDETFIDENGIYTTVLCYTEI